MAKQFVVAVPAGHLEALDKVVARESRAESKWLAKARSKARLAELRGVELSEARASIRRERARLRAEGVLSGTRDLVVARALRTELAERGMDREWEEPPPAETDAPGRRWGSTSWGLDGELDARMPVRLPVELAEQLVRAAYWTSAPAVAELKEWYRRWGDGPEVIIRDMARRNNGSVPMLTYLAAAFARRPDREALLDRVRLQGRIVTTGDLVRAAVRRALLPSVPQQPALFATAADHRPDPR